MDRKETERSFLSGYETKIAGGVNGRFRAPSITVTKGVEMGDIVLFEKLRIEKKRI